MNQKAITITHLCTYIKQIFDAEEMLAYIKVVGEVSGLTISKGVAYFTLKDENAQLPCVCFTPYDFDFKDGEKVYATGTPRFYVKGGKLNFNVSKIEQAGQGELYQRFLELKYRLEKLGYFDEARKKPIPKQIKRIGVVTSAEGAVIRDIINIRNRRNSKIDIVLYPVKVQGVGAEIEIAQGIKFFDDYDVDVVIVGRGGGSLEDLMAFNTEVVANAVYVSKKPIVSAVGHETDFSICDFVSDLRAPTPSAAAEILCAELEGVKQKVKQLLVGLDRNYGCVWSRNKQRVINVLSSFLGLINEGYLLKCQKAKLSISKMESNIFRLYEENVYNHGLLSNKLKKLNPEEILKLGYATIKSNNKYITSAKSLKVGDGIFVNLKDGVIEASVIAKGENCGI